MGNLAGGGGEMRGIFSDWRALKRERGEQNLNERRIVSNKSGIFWIVNFLDTRDSSVKKNFGQTCN